MSEYLTASEAIEKLGIPSTTFYRFVREGKIHKHFPNPMSKHGAYDAKEIARLKSQFRQKEPKETGATDWVRSSDMGAIYDLEYTVYQDRTGDPNIIRKWYEHNPHLCRVLYNAADRKDLWGALNMVPLREETIIKLLRGEMRDIDLDPQEDILLCEKPGAYDFYVASVILRPDKRSHFLLLINSLFDYWCAQAPDVTIGKLYGSVLSEDGEMMVRKLFFSPIWHIADNAYMLDMSKPSPSRIVQSFQYCMKTRSDEA